MTTVEQLSDAQTHKRVYKRFELLHRTVSASYGPAGDPFMLCKGDTASGSLIVSSSSAVLLPELAKEGLTLTRLALAPLAQHHSVYRDFGLFGMLLTTGLIVAGLELGNTSLVNCTMPGAIVAGMYKAILSEATRLLLDPNCQCVRRAPLSDLELLKAVVISALAPKSAVTGVRGSDLRVLAVELVSAFLAGLPRHSSSSNCSRARANSRVAFITLPGLHVSETTVYSGVLLEVNKIEQRFCHPNTALSIRSDGTVAVALFKESLAGGLDHLDTANYPDGVPVTASGGGTVTMMDVGWERLAPVVNILVAAGVELVLCQRVIHPSLKELLWSRGVATIDRLSSAHLSTVIELSGAVVLDLDLNATSTLPPASIGRLANLQTVSVDGKCFVQLARPGGGIAATVLLCASTATAAAELRLCAEAATSGLSSLLRHPAVLAGAGATELYLAQSLRRWARDGMPNSIARVDSTKPAAICVEAFCRALERVVEPGLSLSPTNSNQIGTYRCLEALQRAMDAGGNPGEWGWDPVQCSAVHVMPPVKTAAVDDMKWRASHIVDPLESKLSALAAAVEAAAAVLSVGTAFTHSGL